MDCTGSPKHDYEDDDLNYEPEAYRWIREAQEVYQAQTTDRAVHVHGDARTSSGSKQWTTTSVNLKAQGALSSSMRA
eukprot:6434479-Pyramimonas_sp.AAC.1